MSANQIRLPTCSGIMHRFGPSQSVCDCGELRPHIVNYQDVPAVEIGRFTTDARECLKCEAVLRELRAWLVEERRLWNGTVGDKMTEARAAGRIAQLAETLAKLDALQAPRSTPRAEGA